MKNRPEQCCLVKIIRLLVIKRIPFPKKIRLLDNVVHLVFYPIQLRFHKGPVVFGIRQGNPVFRRLFLFEFVQDILFHFFYSNVKEHGVFRAGHTGSDAHLDNGIFGMNLMEKTSLGVLDFLRDGLWLSHQIVQSFFALREALRIGGSLEALFFEGFDGFLHQRYIGRRVTIRANVITA